MTSEIKPICKCGSKHFSEKIKYLESGEPLSAIQCMKCFYRGIFLRSYRSAIVAFNNGALYDQRA